MFRESQDVQITLDDRMLYANDQIRKAVGLSRAKLVGDIIYPNVDENRFSGLFSEVGSRPNILVRQYVAALVLKRMYRMTDEVMIEFLRCAEFPVRPPYHAGRKTAFVRKFPAPFP